MTVSPIVNAQWSGLRIRLGTTHGITPRAESTTTVVHHRYRQLPAERSYRLLGAATVLLPGLVLRRGIFAAEGSHQLGAVVLIRRLAPRSGIGCRRR